MLPLETELAEFRRAVGNHPGRYRLDPVTENHRACEGGQPAYLQLTDEDDEPAELPPAPTADSSIVEELLRETVRANTQLCRDMADRFAGVMESAAVLLRAADGAGLPAREPRRPEVPEVYRNAELPLEDDDDEDDDQYPSLATVLQTTIDRAMPLVNHAVNTKVLGLSAEQSIALMGGNAGAAHANPAPRRKHKEPRYSADRWASWPSRHRCPGPWRPRVRP
jgi:hypothetical protein